MMRVTICAFCKHKHRALPACTAYPEGIPSRFLSGSEKHLAPAEGDHGVRFSVQEDAPPAVQAMARELSAAQKPVP